MLVCMYLSKLCVCVSFFFFEKFATENNCKQFLKVVRQLIDVIQLTQNSGEPSSSSPSLSESKEQQQQQQDEKSTKSKEDDEGATSAENGQR